MANPTDKMSHIDFRRYIAMVLIKCGDKVITKKKSLRSAANIPSEIRLDNDGHIVDDATQGRCRICKKNTRKKCAKCGIRLHTDKGKTCWYSYHNDPKL